MAVTGFSYEGTPTTNPSARPPKGARGRSRPTEPSRSFAFSRLATVPATATSWCCQASSCTAITTNSKRTSQLWWTEQSLSANNEALSVARAPHSLVRQQVGVLLRGELVFTLQQEPEVRQTDIPQFLDHVRGEGRRASTGGSYQNAALFRSHHLAECADSEGLAQFDDALVEESLFHAQRVEHVQGGRG